MGEGQYKRGVMWILIESRLQALMRGERISSRYPYDTADEQAFVTALPTVMLQRPVFYNNPDSRLRHNKRNSMI